MFRTGRGKCLISSGGDDTGTCTEIRTFFDVNWKQGVLNFSLTV